MQLTLRDREILRTVLRLQLVKTPLLQQAFFTDARNARRRLARLREEGLITRHGNGLPGEGAVGLPAYWRLTEAGLAAALASFPSERPREDYVHRVRGLSLRNHEHRDGIGQLYLDVTHGADLGARRARASAFRWSTETEGHLSYQRGTAEVTLVPDATVTTRSARIFVEVDRSTESRKRCKLAVASYAQFMASGAYAKHFGDTLPAYVVYMTLSTGRRDSLRNVLRAAPTRGLEVAVLTQAETVPWLQEALFGEAAAVPATIEPGPQLATALRALYADYHRELTARQDRGEDVDWPDSLRTAHRVLKEVAPHVA